MSKSQLPFRKVIRDRLLRLLEQKNGVMDEMDKLGVKSLTDGIPQKYVDLSSQLLGLNKEIDQTMVMYTISILESVEGSSRKLELLTLSLTILTIILAILTGYPILRAMGLIP